MYVGETTRALGIRLNEHKNVEVKNKMAVADHQVDKQY